MGWRDNAVPLEGGQSSWRDKVEPVVPAEPVEPAEERGFAEDVALSTGSGIAEGSHNIIGLPVDLVTGLINNVDKLAPRNPMTGEPLWGSPNITKPVMGSAWLKEHYGQPDEFKPETAAGRYAKSGARVATEAALGSVIMPGGGLVRGTGAVGEGAVGAVSGIAGQGAADVSGDNPYARSTAELVTALVGGSKLASSRRARGMYGDAPILQDADALDITPRRASDWVDPSKTKAMDDYLQTSPKAKKIMDDAVRQQTNDIATANQRIADRLGVDHTLGEISEEHLNKIRALQERGDLLGVERLRRTMLDGADSSKVAAGKAIMRGIDDSTAVDANLLKSTAPRREVAVEGLNERLGVGSGATKPTEMQTRPVNLTQAKGSRLKENLSRPTIGSATLNDVDASVVVDQQMLENIPGLTIPRKAKGTLTRKQALKIYDELIDKMFDTSVSPDAPKGRLQEAQQSLAEALRKNIDRVGDEGWAEHLQQVKLKFDEQRRIVDKLNNLGYQPEKIYRVAMNAKGDGASMISMVRSRLSADEWAIISDATIRKMGVASPAAQNAAGDVWNARTFLTNYHQMDPSVRRVLFDNADVGNGIDSLARIAERVAGRTDFVDVSDKYKLMRFFADLTIMPIKQAGTILRGGYASISPARAAKLVTNPKFVRRVINELEGPDAQMPNGVAAISVSSIQQALQSVSAEMPELSNEIQALIDGLNEDVPNSSIGDIQQDLSSSMMEDGDAFIGRLSGVNPAMAEKLFEAKRRSPAAYRAQAHLAAKELSRDHIT